jgi:hypothetical protein
MRIGFDIDGVITKNPIYFSFLTKVLKREGHFVAIVTSRSPLFEVQEATRQELKELDIIFDDLYFLPEDEDTFFHYPLGLDWFQKRIWLKANYCQTNKLEVFYEDDTKTIALIEKYAPNTNVMHVK